MTVINTNTGALYAQQAMNTNERGLAMVMQQLSTGKRINNAVDDVAGMAISTRLTSQIRGLNQAMRNANDGISLIQTAEGATEQVTKILQRMRELDVQASNDTNNAADRSFLDAEFQQLKAEISRIGQNTQWNGANILDGAGGNSSNGTFVFQVGANANQTIGIQLGNLQVFSNQTFPFNRANINGSTGALDGQLDFTGLNSITNTNDLVGRSISVTVDGKLFGYAITQNDINTVGATNIAGGTPTNTIATQVVGGLVSNMTYGTANYTFAADNSPGKLDVVHRSGVTAVFDNTNNKVFSGNGDLTAIRDSDITTINNAYSGLAAIDSAMQTVNSQRSALGSTTRRLQFASDNLSNVSAKAAESKSRIEDADYSTATMELAKRNIIQQAAQAMLAQANQVPQIVLQLLK